VKEQNKKAAQLPKQSVQGPCDFFICKWTCFLYCSWTVSWFDIWR